MAHGESNGHMTDDVGEVLIVTLVCLGAREASSKKSHGTGQTPCSYERYLVKKIKKKHLQTIITTICLVLNGSNNNDIDFCEPVG